MAIEWHFVRAAKDLASLHICTGLPKPLSLYKISCPALNGDLCAIHASSEYSGESAHLRRQSLDNVINIKISVLAAKALGSLHVCTGSPEPSSQYQNIMCWLKWRFL